jgi:N-acetylglutamate synthase-like GNAT family acetyltransferase
MPVMPKKIRRRRSAGELAVEQTHDAAVIAAMLDRAGIAAPVEVKESTECFLIAYWGDDPAGIAVIETDVDAALMRPLFVLESMRRRGIGASLVRAVRLAAHTRGARILYATVPATLVGYFAGFGFADTSFDELVKACGQASMLQRTWLDNAPACRSLSLDLSRDGLIER